MKTPNIARQLLTFILTIGLCGTLLAGFCVKCGKHLDDTVKFCPNCGHKVGDPLDQKGVAKKEAKPAEPPVFMNIEEANKYFDLAEKERTSIGAFVLPFHKKRRYQKALDLYLDIIKKWPNSDKCELAAYNAALIYESISFKDYNKAIRYYKMVTEINPETTLDSRLRIAVITDEKILDYDSAVILYERAIADSRVQKEKEEAAKYLRKLREKQEKAREKLQTR